MLTQLRANLLFTNDLVRAGEYRAAAWWDRVYMNLPLRGART